MKNEPEDRHQSLLMFVAAIVALSGAALFLVASAKLYVMPFFPAYNAKPINLSWLFSPVVNMGELYKAPWPHLSDWLFARWYGGVLVAAGLFVIFLYHKPKVRGIAAMIALAACAGCASYTYDPYGDPTRVVDSRLSRQELTARGYAVFEHACYGVAPYQKCSWETETQAHADAAQKRQDRAIARYMAKQQKASPLNIFSASPAVRYRLARAFGGSVLRSVKFAIESR